MDNNDDNVYQFEAELIGGGWQSLEEYRGKSILVVNTASKCGFTPQYAGLQQLWERHRDDFVVLAFPCDQFGGQEPGSAEEISRFCEANYGVSFPLFTKIEVNGANTHPLFAWLKERAPGLLGTKNIKWNFTKFLISPDGKSVSRFGSNISPEDLENIIDEHKANKNSE